MRPMYRKIHVIVVAIIILFLCVLAAPAHSTDGCETIPCISATSWAATPTPQIVPPPVAYVYLPVVY